MNKTENISNFYPKMISENISKRITSLRFLLIVFVVFIHNNLNSDTIPTPPF